MTTGDKLGLLKVYCILGNHSNFFLFKYVPELQADIGNMTREGSQGSSQVDIMFHVSQHSLVVAMAGHLHWLGFRSLREVSAGKVMLKDNPQLCYTQPFQWTRLFRSADQTATIHNNKPIDICGKFVFVWEWCWSAIPSEHPTVLLIQSSKSRPVTRSAQPWDAGVQVLTCACPVATLAAGVIVCNSATCCMGEDAHFL